MTRPARGARFGWDCHGLPAEIEAERELGISGHAAIGEFGIDRFNPGLPHGGAALHPRVAAVRHPARAVGQLRRRLQDDGPSLHGERHLGVQAALEPRPGLRGLSGPPVLLGVRDTALATPRPGMDDAYRDRQDPAIHRGVQTRQRGGRPGLDDDTLDAPVEPRAGREPGPRVRAYTSSTASAYVLARLGAGALRHAARRRAPGRHASR